MDYASFTSGFQRSRRMSSIRNHPSAPPVSYFRTNSWIQSERRHTSMYTSIRNHPGSPWVSSVQQEMQGYSWKNRLNPQYQKYSDVDANMIRSSSIGESFIGAEVDYECDNGLFFSSCQIRPNSCRLHSPGITSSYNRRNVYSNVHRFTSSTYKSNINTKNHWNYCPALEPEWSNDDNLNEEFTVRENDEDNTQENQAFKDPNHQSISFLQIRPNTCHLHSPGRTSSYNRRNVYSNVHRFTSSTYKSNINTKNHWNYCPALEPEWSNDDNLNEEFTVRENDEDDTQENQAFEDPNCQSISSIQIRPNTSLHYSQVRASSCYRRTVYPNHHSFSGSNYKSNIKTKHHWNYNPEHDSTIGDNLSKEFTMRENDSQAQENQTFKGPYVTNHMSIYQGTVWQHTEEHRGENIVRDINNNTYILHVDQVEDSTDDEMSIKSATFSPEIIANEDLQAAINPTVSSPDLETLQSLPSVDTNQSAITPITSPLLFGKKNDEMSTVFEECNNGLKIDVSFSFMERGGYHPIALPLGCHIFEDDSKDENENSEGKLALEDRMAVLGQDKFNLNIDTSSTFMPWILIPLDDIHRPNYSTLDVKNPLDPRLNKNINYNDGFRVNYLAHENENQNESCLKKEICSCGFLESVDRNDLHTLTEGCKGNSPDAGSFSVYEKAQSKSLHLESLEYFLFSPHSSHIIFPENFLQASCQSVEKNEHDKSQPLLNKDTTTQSIESSDATSVQNSNKAAQTIQNNDTTEATKCENKDYEENEEKIQNKDTVDAQSNDEKHDTCKTDDCAMITIAVDDKISVQNKDIVDVKSSVESLEIRKNENCTVITTAVDDNFLKGIETVKGCKDGIEKENVKAKQSKPKPLSATERLIIETNSFLKGNFDTTSRLRIRRPTGQLKLKDFITFPFDLEESYIGKSFLYSDQLSNEKLIFESSGKDDNFSNKQDVKPVKHDNKSDEKVSGSTEDKVLDISEKTTHIPQTKNKKSNNRETENCLMTVHEDSGSGEAEKLIIKQTSKNRNTKRGRKHSCVKGLSDGDNKMIRDACSDEEQRQMFLGTEKSKISRKACFGSNNLASTPDNVDSTGKGQENMSSTVKRSIKRKSNQQKSSDFSKIVKKVSAIAHSSNSKFFYDETQDGVEKLQTAMSKPEEHSVSKKCRGKKRKENQQKSGNSGLKEKESYQANFSDTVCTKVEKSTADEVILNSTKGVSSCSDEQLLIKFEGKEYSCSKGILTPFKKDTCLPIVQTSTKSSIKNGRSSSVLKTQTTKRAVREENNNHDVMSKNKKRKVDACNVRMKSKKRKASLVSNENVSNSLMNVESSHNNTSHEMDVFSPKVIVRNCLQEICCSVEKIQSNILCKTECIQVVKTQNKTVCRKNLFAGKHFTSGIKGSCQNEPLTPNVKGQSLDKILKKDSKCDIFVRDQDLCKKAENRKVSLGKPKIVIHRGIRNKSIKKFKEEQKMNRMKENCELRRHPSGVQLLQSFICSFCQRNFSTLCGIQRHIRLQHRCVCCNEILNSRSAKLEHFLHHHTSEVHCCLLCRKEFPKPSQLKTHLKASGMHKELFKTVMEHQTKCLMKCKNLDSSLKETAVLQERSSRLSKNKSMETNFFEKNPDLLDFLHNTENVTKNDKVIKYYYYQEPDLQDLTSLLEKELQGKHVDIFTQENIVNDSYIFHNLSLSQNLLQDPQISQSGSNHSFRQISLDGYGCSEGTDVQHCREEFDSNSKWTLTEMEDTNCGNIWDTQFPSQSLAGGWFSTAIETIQSDSEFDQTVCLYDQSCKNSQSDRDNLSTVISRVENPSQLQCQVSEISERSCPQNLSENRSEDPENNSYTTLEAARCLMMLSYPATHQPPKQGNPMVQNSGEQRNSKSGSEKQNHCIDVNQNIQKEYEEICSEIQQDVMNY